MAQQDEVGLGGLLAPVVGQLVGFGGPLFLLEPRRAVEAVLVAALLVQYLSRLGLLQALVQQVVARLLLRPHFPPVVRPLGHFREPDELPHWGKGFDAASCTFTERSTR